MTANITKTNPHKYFPGYIGQTDCTTHLATMIDACLAGRPIILKPQFLGGLAGQGKTELMVSTAKALVPRGFKDVEIPNSVTLPQFLQIWGDLIEQNQAVIRIDEVHNMKNAKVVDLIKRITETGGESRPVRAGDAFITADPFKHLWMAASNMDATDSALFGPTGRFQNWTLQPFNEAEVREVMAIMSDRVHVKIHKPAEELLVQRVMPNGRSIRNLVNDLALYCPSGVVTIDNAKAIIEATGRFPKGLTREDIRVLNYLKSDPRGKQVGEIGAACGGEDPKVLGYRIRQLAGLNLLQTTSQGRKALTEQGTKYIEDLAKMQQAAKAARAAKAGGKINGVTVKAASSVPEEKKAPTIPTKQTAKPAKK